MASEDDGAPLRSYDPRRSLPGSVWRNKLPKQSSSASSSHQPPAMNLFHLPQGMESPYFETFERDPEAAIALHHLMYQQGRNLDNATILTEEHSTPEQRQDFIDKMTASSFVPDGVKASCLAAFNAAVGGHLGVLQCGVCGREGAPETFNASYTDSKQDMRSNPNVHSFKRLIVCTGAAGIDPVILTDEELAAYNALPPHVTANAENMAKYMEYRKARNVVLTQEGRGIFLVYKGLHFLEPGATSFVDPLDKNAGNIPIPSNAFLFNAAASETREAYVAAVLAAAAVAKEQITAEDVHKHPSCPPLPTGLNRAAYIHCCSHSLRQSPWPLDESRLLPQTLIN